jgi:hypothetical protein
MDDHQKFPKRTAADVMTEREAHARNVDTLSTVYHEQKAEIESLRAETELLRDHIDEARELFSALRRGPHSVSDPATDSAINAWMHTGITRTPEGG